ncbi:hypothetical protein NHH03_10910 [Stieleria sp. TO1_6]|uniref:hypothetical protein n=1 Tax=Stieleria tagensis TaxID=2956795 RepID=UPI00209B8752|nr:hypothetical protein [Stieleria tagensis]MCO8122250.1 hypothetical protein [Stieleria tagensis]
MNRMFAICCCAVSLLPVSAGCGAKQPTNVMENTDQQALADYERMIAEGENAMDSEKTKP